MIAVSVYPPPPVCLQRSPPSHGRTPPTQLRWRPCCQCEPSTWATTPRACVWGRRPPRWAAGEARRPGIQADTANGQWRGRRRVDGVAVCWSQLCICICCVYFAYLCVPSVHAHWRWWSVLAQRRNDRPFVCSGKGGSSQPSWGGNRLEVTKPTKPLAVSHSSLIVLGGGHGPVAPPPPGSALL